jgi:hypothetical protein
MLCDAVAIGTRAWNVGASRAERAQASLGLVIERSRRYRLNPHHTDEITRFVRGTLGCQCPDDVFQSIVIGQERSSNNGAPFTRLLVGDRLLIYIHETQPAGATTATVSRLAQRGLTERDAKQYNRFRLVIVADDPTEFLTAARSSFASVTGTDDRAHLHILATHQLPHALRVDLDGNRPDIETAVIAPAELPPWLRGDPIAEHLRSLGRPVTKAAWLECAYGSSNEIVLEQDKETRAWIRSHFPADPHDAVK